MLLVSGATATMRPLVEQEPRVFGTLVVPADGNLIPEMGRWAGDNGAFTRFDEPAFLRMLERCRWAKERCLFIAAPDVVGKARETADLFREWAPRIRAYHYPVALVAQDGLSWPDVPWDQLDCIFIGGTTAYKLGAEAARIVVEAHLYGKWVHMGRVNTARRLQYAAAIGVDSVDGSGWSRFPSDMLRRHGALLRTLSEQRRLLLGAA
jgi:hypothetical protein